MSCHIAIFDDDKTICKLLQDALSAIGHKVTVYSNPTEFPYFNDSKCPCDKESPCADILLSDIVMPQMEGIDFFRKLKDSGCRPLKNNNVAIMSGYLTIHYMNDLNELGVNYFRKPFELSAIYKWVKECEERILAASNA